MSKYAFVYKIYRHVYDFCGPYESYEKMMNVIASLALEDDAGVGDCIQEELKFGEESPKDVVLDRGIRIFKVSEEDIDHEDIYNRWKKEVAAHDKEMKKIFEKQQEERDRKEYERLKEKYEKEC